MEETDRRVLELAGRWYRNAGAREQAIADELGLTPTRYAQILNRLIDDPAAPLEHGALLARIRRQRDQRLTQKVGRRSA